MIDYWPLLGIALVVVGFALRFNPLLVVAVAAIVTGLLGGMHFLKVLSTLGKGFNDNRYVSITYIVLPVIGLLERFALQERARALIAGMRGATTGRLLIVYLGFRQIFAYHRYAFCRGAAALCRKPERLCAAISGPDGQAGCRLH